MSATAEPAHGETALELMQRAVNGATNDELFEITFTVFEELADRAETIVALAVDMDDREIANEAFVLADRAHEVIPNLRHHNKRISNAWHKIYNAKERIAKAVRRQRAGNAAPSVHDRVKSPGRAKPKDTDGPAIFDPQAVMKALETAVSNARSYKGNPTGSANTHAVGEILMPDTAMIIQRERSTQASRAQLRLAAELARLADAGKIVRLRPKRGGSIQWALYDHPYDEDYHSNYLVDPGKKAKARAR